MCLLLFILEVLGVLLRCHWQPLLRWLQILFFFFLSPHQFTLFSLIGYFIYLIFKLYSLSRFTLFKYPMPSHLSCFYEGVPTPATHSCLTTIVFFYIGASSLPVWRDSPPTDARWRHFSFFSSSPNSSIGIPVLSLMVDCEHPHLYWSGSGRACQETAVSLYLLSASSSWHLQ